MRSKKSSRANLEKRRSMFFQIGVLSALAVVLLAFEWSVPETTIENWNVMTDPDVPVAEVDITFPEEEKEVKPPQQKVIDEIKVVEEEIIPEDQPDIEFIENIDVDIPIVDLIEEEVSDEVIPFPIIEKKPEFPGGLDAYAKFIATETVYSENAKEAGLKGTVYVSFIIDENGKVTNVEIARGIHEWLDDEAIRVVKSMPDWKPGEQRGKPVKVSFMSQFKFILTE